MLSFIKEELSKQRDVWILPPLPNINIDWLRFLEQIHDNPGYYIPAAAAVVCFYAFWAYLPSILKNINAQQKQKELLKLEQLKKEQKGEIPSNPDDNGSIATSFDAGLRANEDQSDLFDNLSFFDFF